MAAAALIAAIAALAVRVARDRDGARRLATLLCACAALAGVLSAGAAIWLVPALVAALALLVADRGARAAAREAGVFAAGLVVLCLPVVLSGGLLPPTSAPLTDPGATGNLLGALDPAQLAGIWPSGDFRLDPGGGPAASLLIAVALGLAAAGLVVAWRSRARAALLYVGATLASCLVIALIGSPWVAGKALATASPAIPFAAGLGAGWLLVHRSRPVGLAGLALLATGVLWSNALAYRDVDLAPREQLVELERIGESVAGDGPTLMTEYSPYGVRHFLRDADPEGVSELRRRVIPLRAGGTARKGSSADTDALDPGALSLYRTLVIRRSPAQSRPPSAYRLVWRGRFYEAWQRPPGPASIADRLALGDRHDPVGVPDCGRVLELARRADLIAAARPRPLAISLARARYPTSWATPRTRDSPVPDGAGSIRVPARVARAGDYEIWLRGSVRSSAELLVDGRPAGEVGGQLNNSGGYVLLGTATLARGRHTLEVRLAGAGPAPGGGGSAGAVGPLVLSRGEAADARLIRVDARRARRLCGARWDWIELAR